MPKSRLLVVVLALLALFVAPSLASAAEPAQWTVNTATGAPLPAVDYQLVNTGGGSRIGYQDRTGVDLGWTSSGGNFQFIRAGAQPGVRDHRAFKPEEAVALYNTKTKRYLAYGSQTFGINLDWSSARSSSGRSARPARGSPSTTPSRTTTLSTARAPGASTSSGPACRTPRTGTSRRASC